MRRQDTCVLHLASVVVFLAACGQSGTSSRGTQPTRAASSARCAAASCAQRPGGLWAFVSVERRDDNTCSTAQSATFTFEAECQRNQPPVCQELSVAGTCSYRADWGWYFDTELWAAGVACHYDNRAIYDGSPYFKNYASQSACEAQRACALRVNSSLLASPPAPSTVSSNPVYGPCGLNRSGNVSHTCYGDYYCGEGECCGNTNPNRCFCNPLGREIEPGARCTWTSATWQDVPPTPTPTPNPSKLLNRPGFPGGSIC
ncbi:MAG: hypothetical protein IT371_12210 [Deltaproteobacteria bacterium]|nr:hypothetical protein [Deltaproteobacteria bacterium]